LTAPEKYRLVGNRALDVPRRPAARARDAFAAESDPSSFLGSAPAKSGRSVGEDKTVPMTNCFTCDGADPE